MGSQVPESMARRFYQCMCSIKQPTASGNTSASTASGASREQLLIFLADTLRGTAEERAPLVMAMSQGGAPSIAVTCDQVGEVSGGICVFC